MVDTALIPGRQPFNTLGCLPVPVLLVIESVAQEFPAFFLDDDRTVGITHIQNCEHLVSQVCPLTSVAVDVCVQDGV